MLGCPVTHGLTNEENLLSRWKRAELTGGLGAGVLGMGLGVALGDSDRGAAPADRSRRRDTRVGMWDRHRIEIAAETMRPSWDTLLYSTCGALLIGLAIYLVGRRVG